MSLNIATVNEEIRRLNERLDKISVGDALRGVRRIASRSQKSRPNWVLAMEIFGLGSTYAIALCRRYGLDPDACK